MSLQEFHQILKDNTVSKLYALLENTKTGAIPQDFHLY